METKQESRESCMSNIHSLYSSIYSSSILLSLRLSFTVIMYSRRMTEPLGVTVVLVTVENFHKGLQSVHLNQILV